MKGEGVLLLLAVMAVAVSVIGSLYTYSSIQNYKSTWFTGQAINEGTLIVNISATAIINFTQGVVNFSYGSVSPGASFGNISTPYGVVSGNWTNQTNGFVIENQGSTNITLSLRTDKDSSSIGGASPGFWWNITGYYGTAGTGFNNGSATKAGNYSCLNAMNQTHNQQNDTYNLSVWTPVQTSNWKICDRFVYRSGNNSVKIDVMMQIPRDAVPSNLTTVFTATATCCLT